MGEIKTSDILAMSIEQRLELLELVWDSLVETPEKVLVPAWHLEAIDRALDAHERDPDAGAPWEEVVQKITGRS